MPSYTTENNDDDCSDIQNQPIDPASIAHNKSNTPPGAVPGGVLLIGVSFHLAFEMHSEMNDQSHLDRKYFIDPYVYNCPFCNRRNVCYEQVDKAEFDWNDRKKCYIYFVRCTSCLKDSMHLSYEDLRDRLGRFRANIDIDENIFYSVPTSYFVIDNRIPSQIRELITEAEGCIKMNFLTGASACVRKAIYELLVHEKASEDDYQDKIKSLKKKYPASDPDLFDILAHIQDMTCDKIHEQSWDKWDSSHLKLIIETIKAVLYDIYVEPKIKDERRQQIQKLRSDVTADRVGRSGPPKVGQAAEG